MMVSGCPIRAKFQDLGSLETRKYQKNLKSWFEAEPCAQ